MSLRGKILLLFVTLAIVPLLALALFAYVQAAQELRRLAQQRIDILAEELAWGLEEEYGRMWEEVAAVVDRPTLVSALESHRDRPVGGLGEAGWDEGSGAIAELKAYGDTALRALSVWLHAAEVRDGRDSALLKFSYDEREELCEGQPPGRRGGQIGIPLYAGTSGDRLGLFVGTVRVDRLLPGEFRSVGLGGSTVIVDRPRGVVLASRDCKDEGAQLASLAGPEGWDVDQTVLLEKRGRFTFDTPGGPQLGAFVSLDEPPWTVITTAALGDFTAPLSRLRLGYGLFVLCVAAATAVAFSMLVGRVMRSLGELATAADRIGEGDLTPWLPPPLEDEVGRLSFSVGRMVKRLRQMMLQIERSSRLAVVGQLASHLSHEVRNPLSSIKLNLQSLRRQVDRGEVDRESAQEITISLREVERLERFVSNVLTLGRSRPVERRPCRVNGLVEEAAEFLDVELKRRGVMVETDLGTLNDTVLGDHGQLKAALLNLFLNGADAMPSGGRLSVRTENVGGPGEPSGIRIRIVDEGSGIPPEIRDRIFEPFFSTKPQGSGIGLALSLETARHHGGDLVLVKRSELETGSEFVMTLPLYDAGMTAEESAPPTSMPHVREARAGVLGGRVDRVVPTAVKGEGEEPHDRRLSHGWFRKRDSSIKPRR